MATHRRAPPRRLHRRCADPVRRAASPLSHRDAHHVRAAPSARRVAARRVSLLRPRWSRRRCTTMRSTTRAPTTTRRAALRSPPTTLPRSDGRPTAADLVAALIVATAGHLADDARRPPTNADPSPTRRCCSTPIWRSSAPIPARIRRMSTAFAPSTPTSTTSNGAPGARAVLQRFLERQRLFVTEFMHATFEHRARANIEAELAALRAE